MGSIKGQALPANFFKTLMKKHSGSWSRAPADVKARYQATVPLHRSASSQTLSEDTEHAQAQLDLLRSRAQLQEELARPPLSLSACKFSAAALEDFQVLAGSEMFYDTAVAALRQKARLAPEPPSAFERQQLSQIVAESRQGPEVKPSWLSAMCRLRSHFAEAAVAIPVDQGFRFFKFVYATQQPLAAYFAPLEEQPELSEPVVLTAANWEQVAMNSHEHAFTVAFDKLLPWDRLPHFSEDQLEVVASVRYQGGKALISDAAPVSFRAFLSTLPPLPEHTPRAQATKSRLIRGGAAQALQASHPFLEHFLSETAQTSASRSSPGTGPTEPRGPDEERAILDDEELEAVFDELHKAREGWAATTDTIEDDFKVNLLGGAWSMQTKGKAVAACLASSRNQRANQWCAQ